jgi:predicted RNase H-like nuclease (RuvC/YqgF family)
MHGWLWPGDAHVNPSLNSSLYPATCASCTSQKDLALTKQQVEELNTQLSALRAQFEEKTAEQKELKAKADLMERRLIAASRLIAGTVPQRTAV